MYITLHGLVTGLPRYLSGKESACQIRSSQVRSPGLGDPLSWEDPLKKGMATHSSILAWKYPMNRGAWLATVHGVSKSLT